MCEMLDRQARGGIGPLLARLLFVLAVLAEAGGSAGVQQAPGGYPAGTYVNAVEAVAMSSGEASAGSLMDGVQQGFYGQKGLVASTQVEDDPWIRVDLGRAHRVVAAELWTAKNPCEKLKPSGTCRKPMQVSGERPMVVSLEGPDGQPTGREATLREQASVFTWERIYATGRYVTFRLPGQKRQLSGTEVKVFVEDPEGRFCTERSCSGGVCTCEGGPSCPRKVCQCNATRLGTEDCFAVAARDWRYLPLQSAGPSRQWNPELWARLMGELQRLQNPDGPCKPQVWNGLIGAFGRGAGLASTLHFVAGHLSDALANKRPFVFGGRFNYAGTKHCKQKRMLGDFDCYFKAFAGGTCKAAKDQARKRFKGIPINKRQPHRCAIGKLCQEVGHFKRPPEDPVYRHQGNFWWRTAMVAHLVQPNADTVKALGLEALKQRIGFRHPIVGVHVRHGDACHTTLRKGRCKGLHTYLPEIRTLARRYNTTRVFLATDSVSVVKETKKYSGEFEFVFADANRNIFQSKSQIEHRTDLWNGSNNAGHEIMLSSLIDVFLLAESDYLVLHLLSNMSRLALELSAAHHLRVPPFISMDGPWCPHWKMCGG